MSVNPRDVEFEISPGRLVGDRHPCFIIGKSQTSNKLSYVEIWSSVIYIVFLTLCWHIITVMTILDP